MAAEGFFSRWSQRKLAERKPHPPDAPAAGAPEAAAPAVPAAPHMPGAAAAPQPVQPPPAPAPTLQDVAALHKDSDFSPFVARAVQPAVRNAAMRKLFSDPHFNLMDGLDTYIDDYARPDPLPAAMLRKMASAQFLKLFDDEKDQASRPAQAPAADQPREDADGAAPLVVAQSAAAAGAEPGATPNSDHGPPARHDEDTDLRLQPDDAAGAARAGRGTE